MNPAVEEMVRRCRRCYLGSLHHDPLPFEGKKGATFLVLGPAPSEPEDVKGWQWTGAGGRTMRRIMVTSGIPQSDVAWGHVVSCRVPRKGRNGGVPKQGDIEACSTIRTIQVKAVGPRVVILAGATALRAYRPDWEFKDMVGWPFMLDGVLFISVPHPVQATGQSDSAREVEEEIRRTVVWARRRARSGNVEFGDWPDVCSVCRGEMWVFDEMGVPYCEEHGDLIGREQIQARQMRMLG